MFAFQDSGVKPDVVVVAKPLAGGIPLGAFIAGEELATALPSGQHGTTFGGGPLACRVALEYFAIVEEENLLQNAARVGAYFHEQLQSVAAKSSLVREVRGRGLMQAIELAIPARPLVERALGEGVLFNSTHDTVLRFLPSFLIQEKHVDRGIRVLRKLLREAKKTARSAAAD
jgi:acetylornithine/succinyldiaminopimelate/putrescine aminotransferase